MIRTRPITGQLRALGAAFSILLCGPTAYSMDGEGDLSITEEKWTFTLSGGKSMFENGSANITTQDTLTTFTYLNTEYTLHFPAATYEADDFNDGYSVQGTIARQMNNWVSLGLQSGVSFGHSQRVVDGMIPFYSYDSSGNLIAADTVGYKIDYKFITYYAAPLLTVGRYIPLGSFAWKPYINAGAGLSSTQEKVVLHVTSVDFDLGKRTTTAVTTLIGAGVDFRISPSGSLGIQYQAQRVLSDENWGFGLPILRFSYLF